MTILFSLKFWSGVQLFIDLVLIGLFMALVARLKKQGRGDKSREEQVLEKTDKGAKEAGRTASRIIDMLEPLVKEADAAAKSFDGQIRDKKNLIQGLNDSLDSRIISINLLLSRAESLLARATPVPVAKNDPETDVFDEQKRIVQLYEKGLDADAIAARLSMPKGEVQLVITLKEKFMAMEGQ